MAPKPLSAQTSLVTDDLSGAVPADVSVPPLQINEKSHFMVSTTLLPSSPNLSVPSMLLRASACAARTMC